MVIAFAAVAVTAGTNSIFPYAFAAVTDWQHMIQCGVAFLYINTAVLAAVLVAEEYVLFAEAYSSFLFLIFP